MNKSILALCAVLAAFGMIFASVAVSHSEDAVSETMEKNLKASSDMDNMGTSASDPAIIEIAPGYSWTYTPKFPDDLSDHITLTLVQSSQKIAGFADAEHRTVKVVIPKDAAAGTTYDLEIKASMTSPVEQTKSQYIRFTVVSGLTVSGSIDNIVLGDSISFAPSGTSGMGSVSWKVKNGTSLPSGLSLSNGKVTGTPSKIGVNTVSLTASANGESRDLVTTFTVFSKIVGDSDETIKAFGATASSRTIANPSDIAVKWTAADAIPNGFALDSATGSISGYSSTPVNRTITIEGCSTAPGCPSQKVTKTITVFSEEKLKLTANGSILTYLNNRSAVTAQVTAPQTSSITWSDDCSFATIQSGTLKVVNPTTAGMNQKIVVTASTSYGQTSSIEIGLAVEDTLSVSMTDSMDLISGSQKTASIDVKGGSSNTVTATSSNSAVIAKITGGTLVVSSDGAMKGTTVTVTVTSAAGQTSSCTMTVDVYSKLSFTSAPTGGAIAYAM